MKIHCSCGVIISDSVDYLPHKAYVIGDKDWFDYHDKIDAAIMHMDKDKEKIVMEVRRNEPSRLAWECNSCGRLYLDNGESILVEYLPANNQPNRVFDRNRNDT